MRINGYTARQLALDTIIGNIRAIHTQVARYHEINGENLTPDQARVVMSTLAREHDKLLERSGLDGTALA